MAVPDFQTMMRPLLVFVSDGGAHRTTDIRAALAAEFSLSEADLAEELPSRATKTFNNRVGWALTYLYRTGLLGRPKRSIYAITDRGRNILADEPARVDLKVLAQFPEFHAFRQARSDSASAPSETTTSHDSASAGQTPEEQIESAYGSLRSALAAELLDRIHENTPAFFEQLVLDVLRQMGYGGLHEGAIERLGQSGDEGVDGVIREDALGLDLIYVQAKRWINPVGRPEIQKFVGALHGKRAMKGVFITTSGFSAEAAAYADAVSPRVVLIDGDMLTRLMIDHDVGVSIVRTFAIKRIDLDYFSDEDETGATG
jgi:restriction system protein